MKQFLKQHGLWVLFAAAVVAVALSLMSFFSTTSSPLVNLAGILSSPFRSAHAAVTGWVQDKQNYFADNAALKTDVAQQQRGAAVFVQPVDTAQAVKKGLKLNSRLCHSRTPPAIATC